MDEIVTDYGINTEWKAYKLGHNQFVVNFKHLNGTAFDISDRTFTLEIFVPGGRDAKLTLNQGTGITNGGATGVLTVVLVQNSGNVILTRGDYYFSLWYLFGGLKYSYRRGPLTLSRESNPGIVTTINQPVNLAGTFVNDTVTLAGAGGGVSDWGDIGGTLSNQTDLQTVLTAESAARLAGDNAFDIVEVPGDIATFTVLLAHKNCVLNFRSDTDFTVLLSSVIAVEDFFFYPTMKGAGKPTMLADTGYTYEATSPTIFTTEGGATVYYEGNNVFAAKGALGQVSLEILEPVSSTGVVVKFDLPRTYGYNTPETGDIIFDNTGLGGGITQLMIHNDGAEPAYPTEFYKIVGVYVNNVDNYIWMTVVKPDEIHFVITQKP